MNSTKHIICKFCDGYYDFGSEQSVCSACHAFIYECCSASMTEGLMRDHKEASNDSGNEEPERGSIDWYDTSECSAGWQSRNATGRSSSDCSTRASYSHAYQPRSSCALHEHSPTLTDTQLKRVSLRNNEKSLLSYSAPSLDDLPAEVFLHICLFLDDISLWNLRRSSPRSRQLIDEDIADRDWSNFVSLRWPLFVPHNRVNSWRQLYLNLMDSVTCRFCLERLRLPLLFPVDAPNLRYRRIVNEIKNLCSDPPFGIRILALDTKTYSHCLAGVEGPHQSPYQGGLFHVYVLFPDSYPIRPPVIRFLSRILHPNISFHGDVGMDCIQHNWSLALTLEKLLVSLQSLLTDPYTTVCMEPTIGRLYNQDRVKFEELAKLWTWKFACHEYLSVDFVASMVLPDYIGQQHTDREV